MAAAPSDPRLRQFLQKSLAAAAGKQVKRAGDPRRGRVGEWPEERERERESGEPSERVQSAVCRARSRELREAGSDGKKGRFPCFVDSLQAKVDPSCPWRFNS